MFKHTKAIALLFLIIMLANPAFADEIDRYIQDLQNDNPAVRANAADALGLLENKTTEALIQALGDRDPGVQIAATRALGKFGDEQVSDALIRALVSEKEQNDSWPKIKFALATLLILAAVSVIMIFMKRNATKIKRKEAIAIVRLGLADILIAVIGLMAFNIVGDQMLLAVSAVILGIFTFFACATFGSELGGIWTLSKGGMRASIAISMLVIYFFILSMSIFGHPPKSMTDLTTTILGNFTTIVGVVLAFYFGTSAYVQVSDKKDKDNEVQDDETTPKG